MNSPHPLEHVPLGRRVDYAEQRDGSLLQAVPRALQRDTLIQVGPWVGHDLWRAWEVSWLQPDGRPAVAWAELHLAADSPNLIESKSLKLYLNSLNGTTFVNAEAVRACIQRDLSHVARAEFAVALHPVDMAMAFDVLPGTCIDTAPLPQKPAYCLEAAQLTRAVASDVEVIEEQLHTHLFRSLCLVTGQPDWGSVLLHYRGPRLDHGALLHYLIGYRRHNEFHEHCVERIFSDLRQHCGIEELMIAAWFTRRGGLDINPMRSTREDWLPGHLRLLRQ